MRTARRIVVASQAEPARYRKGYLHPVTEFQLRHGFAGDMRVRSVGASRQLHRGHRIACITGHL